MLTILDACSGIEDDVTCRNSERCVWYETASDESTSACIPVNLGAERDGRQFTFDTGSATAVLPESRCEAMGISRSSGECDGKGGESVDLGYETSRDMVSYAACGTADVLATRVNAVCNVSGLVGGSEKDGLIGVASTPRSYPLHEYSIMNDLSEQRFGVNKESARVCLGSECEGLAAPMWYRSASLSARSDDPIAIPRVEDEVLGSALILDTGSTETLKTDGMCIVGNHDIRHLEIDYRMGTVKYSIDDRRVSAVCDLSSQTPPPPRPSWTPTNCSVSNGSSESTRYE